VAGAVGLQLRAGRRPSGPGRQQIPQLVLADGGQDEAIAFLADQHLGPLQLQFTRNPDGLVAAAEQQGGVVLSCLGVRGRGWHRSKHRPIAGLRQVAAAQAQVSGHGYRPAWRIGGLVVSVSSLSASLVERGHEATVFAANSSLEGCLYVMANRLVGVQPMRPQFFSTSVTAASPLKWPSHVSSDAPRLCAVA